MIPKYHIEYGVKFGNRLHPQDYTTDDPVACEDFLVSILEHGLRLKAVRHEGVELPPKDFDEMVKNAAKTLAAMHVAQTLNLNAEEVHFRFGLAA
jgi:hypothetical protein